MKDTVIKNDGTSRTLKAPSSIPATFAEWREQLVAGTATLDISLNSAGCETVGTALNKANLLSDTTKAALKLTQSDPTVNDALYALSQSTAKAEVHVLADAKTTVTMTKGSTTLSATTDSDGYAILYPTELGDWTVVYTYSGSQKTKVYTLEVFGIVYVYPFTIGDSLEDTTWENISICSELGLADKFFKIGDQKTITLSGVEYRVRIIGFNHDTKVSGGTAGITFQLVNCYATKYAFDTSGTSPYTGGWESSTIRSSTMMTLYLLLFANSGAGNYIKQVTKKSVAGVTGNFSLQTTSDYLFLLSYAEIYGKESVSGYNEGSRYEYYTAGNSRVMDLSGTTTGWWTRSMTSYNASNARVMYVGTAGASANGGVTNTFGVSFAFCI